MVLPIEVDKRSGIPVYIQLGERIRLLVREGVLKAGDTVPTVRSLAVQLGVNANTVARVYRELQADGLLRLERGVGTFVTGGGDTLVSQKDFKQLEETVLELIRLGKQNGMSAGELAQLIETRWKEVGNASR